MPLRLNNLYSITNISLLILNLFLGIYLIGNLNLTSIYELIRPDPIKAVSTIAQNIYNDCRSKGAAENCYKEKFGVITKQKGFKFSENTLYALQEFDPFLRHCHILSHEISKVAVLDKPDLWKDLLKEANINTCGGGFYHGILEAHVGYDNDFTLSADFINQLCNDGTDLLRKRTCTHILGHLITLEHEGELESSAKVCEGMLEELQVDCYTGVFMEESFKTNLAEHGLATLPVRDKERMERQKERCLRYSGTPATACWIDMAEIFIEYYQYDPVPSYNSCMEAPDAKSRTSCYQKAVTLMAISPNYDQPGKMSGPCRLLEKSEIEHKICLNQMISGLMHYSPKYANRAIALCSDTLQTHKQYCFEEFSRQLRLNITKKSDLEVYCDGTPEEYKKICTG